MKLADNINKTKTGTKKKTTKRYRGTKKIENNSYCQLDNWCTC